jgi:hypothetical protein
MSPKPSRERRGYIGTRYTAMPYTALLPARLAALSPEAPAPETPHSALKPHARAAAECMASARPFASLKPRERRGYIGMPYTVMPYTVLPHTALQYSRDAKPSTPAGDPRRTQP